MIRVFGGRGPAPRLEGFKHEAKAASRLCSALGPSISSNQFGFEAIRHHDVNQATEVTAEYLDHVQVVVLTHFGDDGLDVEPCAFAQPPCCGLECRCASFWAAKVNHGKP